MYASKTTELLSRILRARSEHKCVLAIKPAFDDRYSVTEIVTHDGLRANAESITEWGQVSTLVANAAVVFIDEVQFFSQPQFKGDIVEHIRDCLITGTDVVVSGLDMDWQGYAFNITAQIAAMADEIHKKTANCTICGKPAVKTYKKSHTGDRIELGATDSYESRCNEHW
jgi:thymidine kinase